MKNFAELVDAVSALDASELDLLQGSITQARGALIEKRNSGLPEFPYVIGVQGHGVPTQVSRETAVRLLAAGSHRLPTEAEMI
jgi:hypothetical protein